VYLSTLESFAWCLSCSDGDCKCKIVLGDRKIYIPYHCRTDSIQTSKILVIISLRLTNALKEQILKEIKMASVYNNMNNIGTKGTMFSNQLYSGNMANIRILCTL